MTDNFGTVTPPGWYADPQDNSIVRYWDGMQWTQYTQPAQSPQSTTNGLAERGMDLLKTGQALLDSRRHARADEQAGAGVLASFQALVEGTNARVNVYPDFIEYDKPMNVSKGKVTAAVMTGGLSLLATGVKDRTSGGTITLPIEQIMSVATKNDGMRNSILSVTTAGGAIQFRGSKSDIDIAKPIILNLVAKKRAAAGGGAQRQTNEQHVVVNVTAPAAAPAAAPVGNNVANQLIQLKSLFDAGVLSQDEYDAKRASLVAQL